MPKIYSVYTVVLHKGEETQEVTYRVPHGRLGYSDAAFRAGKEYGNDGWELDDIVRNS